MTANCDPRSWSFGCEHEFGDIPMDAPLPEGYGWDRRDITIVNSNGIANDPTGEFYQFGGEINTPPTRTVRGQVDCLTELKGLFSKIDINYRSNLHVHVRVPGLKDDLKSLKRVQLYIHQWMPQLFPLIEPLPRPSVAEFPVEEELQGALRRWRRRQVSHQTLLSWKRVEFQQRADTVEGFFNSEPPLSNAGKPLWHAQPRLCVNLRQLLQTDTVEFRHFPGTVLEAELETCVQWCRKFMVAALTEEGCTSLLEWVRKPRAFPPFPPYVHWQEQRYRATVHDGTLTKDQIRTNIAAILNGTFDASVSGVPRQRQSVGVSRRRSPGANLFSN